MGGSNDAVTSTEATAFSIAVDLAFSAWVTKPRTQPGCYVPPVVRSEPRPSPFTSEALGAAQEPWEAGAVRARPGGLRVFRSRVLEALTRSPAPWPYVVGLPAAAAAFAHAVSDLPLVSAVLVFVAGAACWTLVEYVMHRWWFHSVPRGHAGRVMSLIVHGHHHLYPSDRSRLAATPWQIGGLVAVVGGLLAPWLSGPWLAAFLSGFVVGWVGYEALHYAAHHGSGGPALLRVIRRHHLAHHFRDPRRGFGISSPTWDRVFPSPRRRDRG